MASDRDTLAALPGMVVHDDELHHAIDQSLAGLYTDWGLSEGLPAPVTVAVHIERDLRAAGWRPPAQEITTAAELDALPRGSAVRTRNGRVWQREIASGVEWWPAQAGWTHGAMTSARLIEMGPVTVVYVPTEEGNRG